MIPTRQTLELLLLALLERRPRHGYGLRADLRAASSGLLDPPPGTLYPVLRGLEAAGLVASRWLPGPARRRRVYSLTSAGGAELARRLGAWSEEVAAMSAVIGGR